MERRDCIRTSYKTAASNLTYCVLKPIQLPTLRESGTTEAVPASEVEAVVRSPTNMAAADIAAADFNKMTSK